ncbi:MAG: nucleotidyltransferase substrate binding protein, hi0074 family [uncultured bacterium]|jgi:nucleotidyltransferase substrate binding protein (TIGR01987 family)|nr:MAG: nucleotidyltransferase substrate binding protein, hi0074 family [uncultured bacterium]KKP29736.1 MAG: Nucleotidyltransferase substrate binding protein, HI0074 family [candidate division TM6 bacterium GW2011_GWF2_30_66]
MEELNLVKDNLLSALDRLGEALQYLEKLRLLVDTKASILMDNDELERLLRDSSIQRFEFCSDLFWKYLKKYEEEVLELYLEAISPRTVILAACKARIVSETDSEILLDLIKSRNYTSHIYKEEVADRISAKIPDYYKTMIKYTEKLG